MDLACHRVSGTPGFIWLEVDLRAKLQLAHVRLAAAGDCSIDTGDTTGIACGAVNATRVCCTRNAQGYMVEDVEGLELELPLDPFGDGEVL